MADKFLMVLLRLCLQPGVSYLYSRPGRMCAALGIERVWRISENGETRARSERKTVRPVIRSKIPPGCGQAVVEQPFSVRTRSHRGRATQKQTLRRNILAEAVVGLQSLQNRTSQSRPAAHKGDLV